MIHIAVLASGTGTNAEALIQHFTHNDLAKVELIVTNNPHSGVVAIAEEYQVALKVIGSEDLNHPEDLRALLDLHQVSFIVLAGFLRKIPLELLLHFEGRIINIHPALLPKFGGQGMYGKKVHQAVIASGEKESGITIHHVTENYDEGGIIFQAKCLVEENETPESLSEKIHRMEHHFYPIITEQQITLCHP